MEHVNDNVIEVSIGNATLILGDAAKAIPHLPYLDAVVTDGPYGISFMGKGWDYAVPKADFWGLVAERMKPGAYLLNFASARTYHRMAVEVEDAGLEIRDQILWLNGEGFPKSHDLSNAIDKHLGKKRPKVKTQSRLGFNKLQEQHGVQTVNVKAWKKVSDQAITTEAAKWKGWGNALKPAHEPCVMARKPMKASLAANTLQHGVGGLNIDACRIPGESSPTIKLRERTRATGKAATRPGEYGVTITNRTSPARYGEPRSGEELGRYPANIMHDGSEDVVALFPQTKRGKGTKKARGKNNICTGDFGGDADATNLTANGGHVGAASRYFYCAKASPKERDEGLAEWTKSASVFFQTANGASGKPSEGNKMNTPRVNIHPTVKPLALMEHLCKLVTPPGGLVLDPFLGSGTTGVAAVKNGFKFIGIEIDPESFTIAAARIAHAQGLPIPQKVMHCGLRSKPPRLIRIGRRRDDQATGHLTLEETLLLLAAARGCCLSAVNMIVDRARKRPINPYTDEKRYANLLVRAAQAGKLKRAPQGLKDGSVTVMATALSENMFALTIARED